MERLPSGPLTNEGAAPDLIFRVAAFNGKLFGEVHDETARVLKLAGVARAKVSKRENSATSWSMVEVTLMRSGTGNWIPQGF